MLTIILLAIATIGLGLIVAEVADATGGTHRGSWIAGWFIVCAGIATLGACGLSVLDSIG